MSMKPTALIACLLLTISVAGQSRIDTRQSTMTVKVFKAGLFSAFGHNHEIRAPITAGTVVTAGSPSVALIVDARGMQVLDPDLAPDKRAEVQKTMHSAAVLDTTRFPEIRFVSRAIEPAGGNRFRVTGDLSLHGVTRPVVVRVERRNQRYVGSATVKQTEFGIKPVSAGGGTVKVKDAVEIVFDIATETHSPAAATVGWESAAARGR